MSEDEEPTNSTTQQTVVVNYSKLGKAPGSEADSHSRAFQVPQGGTARVTIDIRYFLARLKKLAETCELGGYRKEAIRYRFVCGLKKRRIQRKLLAVAELTLRTAVEGRVSFTGHIPQVTGTGHSNCAPKRNMFLLKIYIRACLVLLFWGKY